jgi:hypothetical protein
MAEDEATTMTPGAGDGGEAIPTDDVDTEGQSFGLLLGMNALGQAREAEARKRTRKAADEPLPPLSRPWPSMREEKKA